MGEEEMKDNGDEEVGGQEEAAQPEEEMGGMEMDMDMDMDMGAGDEATADDKLWALLAYVLTPIVPIILMIWEDKKDRPFIREHNAQALVWGLVNAVLGSILSAVLFFCLGLPTLLLWLVGCYWGWQAYQGQSVTIPVITDFVKQQGWA